MAKATDHLNTKLSQLFTDPLVRSAFQRAERDPPPLPVEPARPAPVLVGGAAERIREDA
jgi:hypothetical protein